MQEILNEITSFVNNGLGLLSVYLKKDELASQGILMEAIFGNVSQIILQLGVLLLLYIVIRKFVWNPVNKILEERQEQIDKNIKEAQALNDYAKETEQKIKNEYIEAKNKIRDMLDEASKESKIERDLIIDDAKKEAKRRLEHIDTELRNEVENAKADIKDAIVEVAFLVAEKIIGKEVNKKEYESIVFEVLKGID